MVRDLASPLLFALCLAAAMPLGAGASEADDSSPREWLAGDHHVHSEFSAGWQENSRNLKAPPLPVLGGDSGHTTLQNAEAAERFGLSWMVTTDHGGPQHSRLNRRIAWPVLEDVRRTMAAKGSRLILFYGMEFDTPGGEHATLMMPRSDHEREDLYRLEAGFDERDGWPTDPARDTKPRMLEALHAMAALSPAPIVLANHPSRTATGREQWGLHAPAEFRDWMDNAPGVAIGMEGIPGHQAAHPTEGLDKAHVSRGLYGGYPTLGGFDQMTAILGGAWDAMLTEGRRWWITGGSDSHGHIDEGGADFWPGEYTKTFVHARRDPTAIMDGLRKGRVFVTTGNLVTSVSLALGNGQNVELGSLVCLERSGLQTLIIRLKLGSPAHGTRKTLGQLDHLDVIVGSLRPQGQPDTRVYRRLTVTDAQRAHGRAEFRLSLKDIKHASYLRLRGTSTSQAEPLLDTPDEDPWSDLWFYTNPVWIAP